MSEPDSPGDTLLETPPSERFLERIPHAFSRMHLLLSIGTRGEREQLAICDETPEAALHNTSAVLQLPVDTHTFDASALAQRIDELYGAQSVETNAPEGALELNPQDDLDTLLDAASRDLLQTQGKGKIIRLVDAILFEALQQRSSDVHIQPLEDRALVRYRVDGALHTSRVLAPHLAQPVISRIKVMGQMDIAERRVAQDGRAVVRIGQRSIDLRISTFPTSYGERTVLRLLDQGAQLSDLDAVGMPASTTDRFLACARRSNGLILVTGPTGSGKTTTLYSTLSRIASSEINIMTVEDPIEYELSTEGLAISQAQVNLKKGVTFASGLRNILRQDPDVVLVGEIRDAETARIAIQASLTGHLVFSTLHTNDAASAVTRLLDLGVEPFLVSASLVCVLAQRLLRKLHDACSGEGCEECHGTGFWGRTGIYELIVVDDTVRSIVARGGRIESIQEAARSMGFPSLRDEGERLARLGLTTLLEVERVVQAAR